MADNSVFITGAAEGAFATALNGIPPWATQKTAEDIEKVLNKMLGVQGKMLAQAIKCCKAAGGDGSTNTKTVNDELDKLARGLKRINEEDAKKKKREKAAEKEDDDELGRSKKKRATDELLQKGLTDLAGAGSKILAVQKQYFITSNDLFKSGVNLLNGNNTTTSSMMSLNQMVTLTGLRLETFQKVVEQFASSINAVGVNKFAKTISLTNSRLIALGYSSEQQAELIGTMIEAESSFSDLRGKNEKQLADDAVRLGKQMTRLSLITGQSAEQLQKQYIQFSKSTDSYVTASVFGAEAAKNLNLLASSAKDTDIGAMFAEIGSAVNPVITATYQSLAKAGAGAQADELVRITTAARDGVISAEEALKQSAAVAKSLNSAQVQALKIQQQAGNEGAGAALKAFGKLTAIGNTTAEATGDQTDAAIAAQASLSRFSTALERTRSLAQEAFPLLESQVNLASFALEKFNAVIRTGTDLFQAETRAWIAVGIEVAAVLAGVVLATKGVKGTIGLLTDVFGNSSKGIEAAGKGTTGAISKLGSSLGFLAKGIGAAGAAFVGYEIGDKVINPLINGAISTLTGRENTLGSAIYDLFNKDNEEIKKTLNGTNSAKPVAGVQTPKASPSVPKEPAPSTVKSPSAVPPDTARESPSAVPPASPAPQAATVQPPDTKDINSVLTYQSALLAQILESSQALVSVNRDILKYTKVHS